MSYDHTDVSYDHIHLDYITHLTCRASLETDSAREFFNQIDEKVKKLSSSHIYKVEMPVTVFDSILKSDDSALFQPWEPYTTAFSPKELNDYSDAHSKSVDCLALSGE